MGRSAALGASHARRCPGAGHGDGQLLGAGAEPVIAQPAPAPGGETVWRRWIVGGVASTVANLVNGRSVETAYRLAARASSPATLHSIQAWKLRRTLNHVARHSAFYKRLFPQPA